MKIVILLFCSFSWCFSKESFRQALNPEKFNKFTGVYYGGGYLIEVDKGISVSNHFLLKLCRKHFENYKSTPTRMLMDLLKSEKYYLRYSAYHCLKYRFPTLGIEMKIHLSPKENHLKWSELNMQLGKIKTPEEDFVKKPIELVEMILLEAYTQAIIEIGEKESKYVKIDFMGKRLKMNIEALKKSAEILLENNNYTLSNLIEYLKSKSAAIRMVALEMLVQKFPSIKVATYNNWVVAAQRIPNKAEIVKFSQQKNHKRKEKN
jgi:hypothetical protein